MCNCKPGSVELWCADLLNKWQIGNRSSGSVSEFGVAFFLSLAKEQCGLTLSCFGA
jgi:hypothetical protein